MTINFQMYVRVPAEDSDKLAGVGVITSSKPLFPEDNKLYCFGGVSLEDKDQILLSPYECREPVDKYGEKLSLDTFTFDEALRAPIWPGLVSELNEPAFGGYMLVRKNQVFEHEEGFRYVFVTAFDNQADLLRARGDQKNDLQEAMFIQVSHGTELEPATLDRKLTVKGLGSTLSQVADLPIWSRGDGTHYRLNTTLPLDIAREFARGTHAYLNGVSPEAAGIHPEVASMQGSNLGLDNDYGRYLKALYPDKVVKMEEHLMPESWHIAEKTRRQVALQKSLLEDSFSP